MIHKVFRDTHERIEKQKEIEDHVEEGPTNHALHIKELSKASQEFFKGRMLEQENLRFIPLLTNGRPRGWRGRYTNSPKHPRSVQYRMRQIKVKLITFS